VRRRPAIMKTMKVALNRELSRVESTITSRLSEVLLWWHGCTSHLFHPLPKDLDHIPGAL
jgi:hypothetical protein